VVGFSERYADVSDYIPFATAQSRRLFVLPPRSPKLNGGVERAHRTHTEEFYEVTDCTFDLAELREKLLEWEHIYNTIRPHQALGYLAPQKFLEQQKRKEVGCH
jgi:transposase InsO family protein